MMKQQEPYFTGREPSADILVFKGHEDKSCNLYSVAAGP